MDEQQLTEQEITAVAAELDEAWEIADRKLRREFSFPDFMAAIRFVNKVAELAEAADHHPDLHIYYKRLTVELTTHKFNGLSDKDFALAKQIERVFKAAT